MLLSVSNCSRKLGCSLGWVVFSTEVRSLDTQDSNNIYCKRKLHIVFKYTINRLNISFGWNNCKKQRYQLLFSQISTINCFRYNNSNYVLRIL